VLVTASHQLGYVTIHTDGWIKLDTKQLDEIAKFDSGARNFQSTRGVYPCYTAPACYTASLPFRWVKKQLILKLAVQKSI